MIQPAELEVLVYWMTEPADDELPPCPVCGHALTDDDVSPFYQELRDGTEWKGDVVECPGCYSMIPLDALTKWSESRRHERIKRTADLLYNSVRRLRELLAR